MWFYIITGFLGMTGLLKSKETKEDRYIKNKMDKTYAGAKASSDTLPEVPFAFPSEGSFGAIASNIKTLGSFFAGNAIQSEISKYNTNKTLSELNSTQNPSGYGVTPIHIVKNGETLNDISKRYGVSKQDIINKNSWLKQSNYIKQGDKITIPKMFDLNELTRIQNQSQSNPHQQMGVFNGQNSKQNTDPFNTPEFHEFMAQRKKMLNSDIFYPTPAFGRSLMFQSQSQAQSDEPSFLESLGIEDMHKKYGHLMDGPWAKKNYPIPDGNEWLHNSMTGNVFGGRGTNGSGWATNLGTNNSVLVGTTLTVPTPPPIITNPPTPAAPSGGGGGGGSNWLSSILNFIGSFFGSFFGGGSVSVDTSSGGSSSEVYGEIVGYD